MARLIALHKPYGVLSQFTDSRGRATLRDFIKCKGVYPAGRLDQDSEGLLLLTDDGAMQARIADPRHKLEKVYIVQVEGSPGALVRQQLLEGVQLSDGHAQAVSARSIDQPELVQPREPPIAPHRAARSSWYTVTLTSGRNRQVRRMMAAVGHPVLRLIRIQIGPWRLDGLSAGESRTHTVHLPKSEPQAFQRPDRS